MTHFRVDRAQRAVIGLAAWAALAVALGSGTAWAQERPVTGPPQGLAPAHESTSPSTDRESRPGVRSIPGRPGLDDGGIQVGTLSLTDGAGIGLLLATTGGFERNMWAGSERLAIETLLPRLPVGVPSPTHNALARRLLLSVADLPKGLTRGRNFLEMRFERLFAAGLLDELTQLARQVPELNRQPGLAAWSTRALLLTGQSVEACRQAAELVAGREAPFWMKVRALCFALAGESAAADLTASLMQDRQIEDPVFYALLTRVTTGAETPIPERVTPLSAVHFALYARLGLAPPQAVIAASSAAVLAALARDSRFDEELRLTAGAAAEQRGALPASSLAALYEAVAFSDDLKATALSKARSLSPGRAGALLYQVVTSHTVPSARAEALAAAVDLARSGGTYAVLARVYWPALRGLQPADPYGAVAVDLARMALIAGDQDMAFAWYDLARSSGRVPAAGLRDMRIALAAAAPSERLGWRSNEPLEWLDATGDAANLGVLTRQIYFLEGLGYPVASAIQVRLLDAPLYQRHVVPAPAVRARLKAARAAKRVGETVLLALVAMGQQGPGAVEPSALIEVYEALSAVGLGQEARHLVFEAVLAAQTSPFSSELRED